MLGKCPLIVLPFVPMPGQGKTWVEIIYAAPRTAGGAVIAKQWGIDPLLRSGLIREVERARRPDGTKPLSLYELTPEGIARLTAPR
jgi:hypothetical protein